MDPNSRRGWMLALIVVLASGAAAGCSKLRARDMLNRGVEAYKAGQYDQAVERFKEAEDLDPALLNAKIYLATAYASQYIPGAPSEENIRKGKQAIQEFQSVLQADPKNLSAIDGTGSILFQMAGTPFNPGMMQQSKEYWQKHMQIRPNDPEPYYWVGVIDWTLAYRANKELRANNNANSRKQVREEDPLPPPVRQQFVDKYGQIVDEGIAALQKAIEVRSDYDDAMAYLNLLERQKADMVATKEEREDYQKKADALVDKVKEVKQKKMENPVTKP